MGRPEAALGTAPVAFGQPTIGASAVRSDGDAVAGWDRWLLAVEGSTSGGELQRRREEAPAHRRGLLGVVCSCLASR